MYVKLIARTLMTELPRFVDETNYGKWANKTTTTPSDDATHRLGGQSLAEFAGRTCYLSYDRPSEITNNNGAYIRNIVAQQHFSVLEHASVSFYVSGVSRSLLAELTRHRHLSFSVQSQRFVKEAYSPVIPPVLSDNPDAQRLFFTAYANARKAYFDLLIALDGLPRKQAREAARSVLPNAQETTMVVSGNLRAWRDVLSRRLSPHADAEIRRFAQVVFDILREEYPDVFEDMEPLRDAE